MDRSSSPGQSNQDPASSRDATFPGEIRSALAGEKALAEQQVAAAAARLEDIIESFRFVATDDEHDPDGSTVAFERSKASALLDFARSRLVQVQTALHRLESGTYGDCENCGKPIGKERLSARPVAQRCVQCARARAGAGDRR